MLLQRLPAPHFYPVAKMKKILFFLSLLIFATSCSDDAEFTTEYQCFFLYDTNIHNTSIIKNAINPASSGTFVKISSVPKNGLRCIVSELNDGKTKENEMITTEREMRQTCILGCANGIIVGMSTLGGGLYAFDAQCPNCVKQYSLYKYPLTWNNNGNWVKCTHCGRKYDLNNNGFIIEGEKGSHLFRYKAYYDGNILNVRN